MNNNEIEKLFYMLQASVEKGILVDWTDIRVYLILVVITGLGSLLGSWAQAYFSKRGEITAIKKDLDKITETQEQIKARISGELWVNQNLWNLKRETYWKLSSVYSQLSSAIHNILTEGFLPDKKTPNPDSAITLPRREKLINLLNESISLTAPSQIVLCQEAVDVLHTFECRLLELNKQLIEKKVNYSYLELLKKAIDDTYDLIISIAKKDLHGSTNIEY